MTNGRVNPSHRLEDQGISGLGNVYYNDIEPSLVQAAVARGEGQLGKGGAFLCTTGQFTGRSPKDKDGFGGTHDLVGKQRRHGPRGV